MEIDIAQLRELMTALEEFDVKELEIEQAGERIFLRRGADTGAAMITGPGLSVAHATLPPTPSLPAAPATAVATVDGTFITSPFVGTFYRSPSPDAAPFVEVGKTIKPGAVICIVEAMKLMNEIEAEFACTILEALVENGKPVEFGDRLFRVQKA